MHRNYQIAYRLSVQNYNSKLSFKQTEGSNIYSKLKLTFQRMEVEEKRKNNHETGHALQGKKRGLKKLTIYKKYKFKVAIS